MLHPNGADTPLVNLSRPDHYREGHKKQLMIPRTQINRLIIFAFMVLVAIALVYGIKSRSVTGIILSLTSLGAGIHFLILLAKAKQEMQQEQEERV